MKLSFTSKCFIRDYSKAIWMVGWLSLYIGTGFRILNEKSFNNCIKPTVCDEAVAKAIYSASVDEADTVGCFLLSQKTVITNSFMMNRVWDFFDTGSSAKSASTIVSIGAEQSSLIIKDSSHVNWRYFNTCSAYIHSSSDGLLVYCARIDTAARISGRVELAIYNNDLMRCWIGLSLVFWLDSRPSWWEWFIHKIALSCAKLFSQSKNVLLLV